jgi:hypothetical protein
MSDKDVSIADTIRQFIRDEVRGMYTASMAIIESVDSETQRVTVSLKSDANVFVDDVPIATPFGGDGVGVVLPLESEMEGLLLHTREPLAEQIQDRGHVPNSSTRRHTLEAAVFIASLWLDDDAIPSHSPGEFVLAIQSDGSTMTMAPDGLFEVSHSSGTVIKLAPDGSVTLGDPNASAPVLTADATLTDSSGGSVTVDDPGSSDTEAS